MKRSSKKSGSVASGRRAPAAAMANPMANPMAEQVGPEFHDDLGVRGLLGVADGDPLAAAELDRLVAERAVLVVSAFDGSRMYPAWQFVGERPLVGLAEVLAAMTGQPAWSVGLWLTTPHDDLGGSTPRAVLEQGGDLTSLVELAAETARRWS